jgi:hypothetical protein
LYAQPVTGLRAAGIIIGLLLAAVGLVWIGQGTGRIKGSFMTGEVVWAQVGALCLVAGGVIAAFAALMGRRRLP